jgi:phenylacetate-CoA ligase
MVTDFKLSKFFYPIKILNYKRFLNKSNNFSISDLRTYQYQKLKSLIKYAYEFVPYYKKLFNSLKLLPKDIRSINDLNIIPPLTKEIVRERFKDLTSSIIKKLVPSLCNTSGSTGTPLSFYVDKNITICKFAIFWRIWEWEGYKFGQRWANITGPVFEDKRILKYIRSLNALYISSFDITKKNAETILLELLKFKPKMLRGYPSSICEFAKFIGEKSLLRKIKVNCIATSSENLLEFQREFLENVFDCKVFDNYSQWEQSCIIAECEKQQKHHQMEYGILELLDENNELVKEGEIGEITGTNLENLAMPLLRYKTRDLAVKSNETCECGRSHDVIKVIDGRIEDIILTPDGRRIGRMDAAFKYNKGFDFAQIIQNELNSIDILLVKNKLYNDEEKNILEKHIRDRVGNFLNINYIFVDRIKPGNNGKIRFVINNMH